MWIYEKRLQYPVKIKNPQPHVCPDYRGDPVGWHDGELGASMRYLNQRYSIPNTVKGALTDIGREA